MPLSYSGDIHSYVLVSCSLLPHSLIYYYLHIGGRSHFYTDMGVMPYVAKSNYSHHPSLGLDKLPGGVCTKFTVYNTYSFKVYDKYVQFKINIFINNSFTIDTCICLFELLILVIYDSVDVVCA